MWFQCSWTAKRNILVWLSVWFPLYFFFQCDFRVVFVLLFFYFFLFVCFFRVRKIFSVIFTANTQERSHLQRDNLHIALQSTAWLQPIVRCLYKMLDEILGDKTLFQPSSNMISIDQKKCNHDKTLDWEEAVLKIGYNHLNKMQNFPFTNI